MSEEFQLTILVNLAHFFTFHVKVFNIEQKSMYYTVSLVPLSLYCKVQMNRNNEKCLRPTQIPDKFNETLINYNKTVNVT